MTTTNNEPLGGDDDLPTSVSIYGSLEECEKERARRASQQAGAAGASEVKPWQERTDEITPTAVVMAMEQEIADLRAQLARHRQGSGEPVATVVSRVGDDLRIGWLRPEQCKVGSMLYTTPAAAQAAQSKSLVGWHPISTLELTSELVWLMRGDNIEGPRVPTDDDYDRFTDWAPCVWPGFTTATAQAAQGEPVAVVDADDDGLFIEILYGQNGSPLKLGDKLYLATPTVQSPADDVRDAAAALLRDELESARERAHPCDQNNDDVVSGLLPPKFQALYRALRTTSAAPADKEGK